MLKKGKKAFKPKAPPVRRAPVAESSSSTITRQVEEEPVGRDARNASAHNGHIIDEQSDNAPEDSTERHGGAQSPPAPEETPDGRESASLHKDTVPPQTLSGETDGHIRNENLTAHTTRGQDSAEATVPRESLQPFESIATPENSCENTTASRPVSAVSAAPQLETTDVEERVAEASTEVTIQEAERLPEDQVAAETLPVEETPDTNESPLAEIATIANGGTVGRNRSNGEGILPSIETPPPQAARAKKQRKTKRAKKDVGDGSLDRPPSKRRKRDNTPDGAENEIIDQSTMKMADLCVDIRIGKKFSRHDELRQRIAKKRTQAALAKRHPELVDLMGGGEETDGIDAGGARDDSPMLGATTGLQMRMVNGQIVLDTNSLQVDRQQQALEEGIVLEEVEEDDFTRITTSGTFLKHTKPTRWDEADDEIFYKGLRQFGTDFEMISKMFPGRSRRHIKLHFTSEERKWPVKIKNALTGVKEEIDFAEYQTMTGLKYEEVADIEAERQRLEDEHQAEEQRQEAEAAESIRQQKDTIRERTEAARRARHGGHLGSDGEEEEPSGAGRRANSLGRTGREDSSGRGKNSKRKNAATSAKIGGEQVEILGTIERD